MPNSGSRLFHRARREAVLVLVVWLLALTWTVGYCYLRGYEQPPDSWVVESGLARRPGPANVGAFIGLPEWVAVGVLLPWLACTAFTVFFCLVVMKDDDLGTEAPEGAGHGH